LRSHSRTHSRRAGLRLWAEEIRAQQSGSRAVRRVDAFFHLLGFLHPWGPDPHDVRPCLLRLVRRSWLWPESPWRPLFVAPRLHGGGRPDCGWGGVGAVGDHARAATLWLSSAREPPARKIPLGGLFDPPFHRADHG